MRKQKLIVEYEQFNEYDELSIPRQKLLDEARKALDKSYSPYSGFEVGAAALLDSGDIVSGANIENASYPLCLCAERVTLSAAASMYPNNTILALAITVRHKKKPQTTPATPCGACRQVILEKETVQKTPIEIILQGESGDIYVIPEGKILLPLGFTPDVLLNHVPVAPILKDKT